MALASVPLLWASQGAWLDPCKGARAAMICWTNDPSRPGHHPVSHSGLSDHRTIGLEGTPGSSSPAPNCGETDLAEFMLLELHMAEFGQPPERLVHMGMVLCMYIISLFAKFASRLFARARPPGQLTVLKRHYNITF